MHPIFLIRAARAARRGATKDLSIGEIAGVAWVAWIGSQQETPNAVPSDGAGRVFFTEDNRFAAAFWQAWMRAPRAVLLLLKRMLGNLGQPDAIDDGILKLVRKNPDLTDSELTDVLNKELKRNPPLDSESIKKRRQRLNVPDLAHLDADLLTLWRRHHPEMVKGPFKVDVTVLPSRLSSPSTHKKRDN
jgi:hypothetical protein